MNCKEQSHEGREGGFKKKKKVSKQSKTKSFLKLEIRHLLFWQLPAARKTPPAKPNFITSVSHHAGKITGCWKQFSLISVSDSALTHSALAVLSKSSGFALTWWA